MGSHGDKLLSYCDIILPIDSFIETESIFVNVEGLAQISNFGLNSPGDSRNLYGFLKAFYIYMMLFKKDQKFENFGSFLNKKQSDEFGLSLNFLSKNISISERLKQTLPI